MLSCIDSNNHTLDTSEVSNNNHNDIRVGIDNPATDIHNAHNLRDTLGRIITEYPFTQVVAMLARVCHAQATKERSTSSDEVLALAWEFNARQLERVTRAAQPTESTILRRSAKLGVTEHALALSIEDLPEPIRSLARDYFHGALPKAGRSTALRSVVTDIEERIKLASVAEVTLEQRR